MPKKSWPILALLFLLLLIAVLLRQRSKVSSQLSSNASKLVAGKASLIRPTKVLSVSPVATSTATPTPTWTATATTTPTITPTATVTPTPTPTPLRIISYTVQSGDTLWSIAAAHRLHVDTLRWSNPDLMHRPDYLRLGQKIVILPFDGVYHTVRRGETVARLAARYHVTAEIIKNCPLNHIPPSGKLVVGQKIAVPGGYIQFNFLPPRQIAGYKYQWPLRGVITQEFHDPRNPSHNGIDIASLYGAPVYASRAGRVIMAKFDRTGYGFTIVIDHGDGWSTLYGHLEGFLVHKGDWVKTGQMMARLGGTGNATGPHVHFEIRHGRTRYNPRNFLPPESTQR